MRFKKSVLIGITLSFAVGILAFSVVRVSAATQSQNYKITTVEENSVDKVATETAQETNNYDLNWQGTVYPGPILPDHFLYPIKMIRDRIWLLLTADTLKRTELLLKFADKRLLTAQKLIEDKKFELGVSTATKGEKYLERAIAEERIAKKAGKDTSAFLQQLSQATLKHQEILTGFREKVSESFKSDLEKIISLTQDGYSRIKPLLSE